MRIGEGTIVLNNKPAVLSYASIVGKKEGEGPVKDSFDMIVEDEMWGEDSFEYSERKFYEQAFLKALSKGNLQKDDVQVLLGGDLLNQIISAGYAARDLKIPFLGLYGACSTMAESLILGAMMVDGGYADNAACTVSSHFATAERQFRLPLEQGGQRTPTSQWTVTGAGSTIVAKEGPGPFITHATIGRIIDLGVTDTTNMGAAMAPAAADTITRHLNDTGRDEGYYDLIVTGDLGHIGREIATQLILKEGYDIRSRYEDCGRIMFDREAQDVHAGASGCACSATILNGFLFKKMKAGLYNNLLFVATGALQSMTSSMQGESMPGIAHAVAFETSR
ncbi:MAG: stage V sporulation protein AD [Christensenellales bacterium]|jgi:stage V sporulation protein AD